MDTAVPPFAAPPLPLACDVRPAASSTPTDMKARPGSSPDHPTAPGVAGVVLSSAVREGQTATRAVTQFVKACNDEIRRLARGKRDKIRESGRRLPPIRREEP